MLEMQWRGDRLQLKSSKRPMDSVEGLGGDGGRRGALNP